jgi:hypothetical protein
MYLYPLSTLILQPTPTDLFNQGVLKLFPLEPGERAKENSGRKRLLFERSELAAA